MSRSIGLALAGLLVCATPGLAQRDQWVGTWGGVLTSAQGERTDVTLTLVAGDEGYSGVVTGFGPNTEIRLTHVDADDAQLTVEGASDTDFGPLRFVYRLSRSDRVLSGGGRVTIGQHGFEVSLELTRARRTDVPQPQVEPRIAYFAGTWQFEYTGGEFPPLSIGTRRGTVTFAPLSDTPFVRAHVEGDVFGDAYRETWTIGFDERTRALAWHEQLSNGQQLVMLGNWTSPIAITFLTAPLEMDGRRWILKRAIRTTSDTAFSVTDEFSVDGGPFRRLGTGTFLRTN